MVSKNQYTWAAYEKGWELGGSREVVSAALIPR
jgi:hypothetical protein